MTISLETLVLVLLVAGLAFYAGYTFGRQTVGTGPDSNVRRATVDESRSRDAAPRNPLPSPTTVPAPAPRGPPPPASAGARPDQGGSAPAAPRRSVPPPPASAALMQTGDKPKKS